MNTRIAGAAVGLAAVAVLSACGGSGGGGSAASTSAGGASSSSSAGAVASSSSGSQPAGSTVQVEAKDFTLSLSTTSLTPGQYTFQMTNNGNATHAIEIDGPGVEDQKSDTAGPGGSASVSVMLQPGTYEIYCPVGNHRAMGMQTSFTVG